MGRADSALNLLSKALDLTPRLNSLVGGQATRRRIEPNAVYALKDTAKLMRCRPADVEALIRTGELKAKHVGDSYVVLGQSILDFFRY